MTITHKNEDASTHSTQTLKGRNIIGRVQIQNFIKKEVFNLIPIKISFQRH